MKTIVHLTSVHNARDPRILEKEAASAARAGYDVTLIAPLGHGDPADRFEGVSFVGVDKVSGRSRRLLSLPRIFRVSRSVAANLYHFHDPELIPVGYFLSRSTRAKVIYDMHEDYCWHGPVEGRSIRLLERWAFGWLDGVVLASPSQLSIDGVTGLKHAVVENFHLVSSPPDLREAPDSGRLNLIYSGVMSESRGLTNLLRLGSLIRERGLPWILDLVGVCYVDAQRERANDFYRSHELAGTVNLTGWSSYVLPSVIDRHQRTAHVGLCLMDHHPRLEDLIPTKFYEYLGNGLPIVCSDIPKWKEFVDSNGCGVAVNPRDAKAVCSALETLAFDEGVYSRLARGASDAAGRFHWKRAEESLLTLYRQVLGDGPG